MTRPVSARVPDAALPLRPPDTVMRLSRMGAFFATRLSFMRILIRRLHAERAVVRRPVWDIDDEGYGCAVYAVPLGGRVYSLVAFSTPLSTDQRTDRVIAEAWDTTYALFDGAPTAEDIDRLRINVPLQEAGRCRASELVLSRANKSVRLFDHVVDRLSHGDQPDPDQVAATGYLMRTTAVYGNGKFGIADRARIADRTELSAPFQAEMLTVWLIRGFTLDLVEHIARARDPDRAVPLAPPLRRHLGIGNATGLGMAPFLVNHPDLLNNWIQARETALARVRNIATATTGEIERFHTLLRRARTHVGEWNVDDPRQRRRIEVLRDELGQVEALATTEWLAEPAPWDWLITKADRWSDECQELLVSLVLEPQGAVIDDLAETLSSNQEPRLDPGMRLADLQAILGERFGWARAVDFDDSAEIARFWYVSEEKLEPRLGERGRDPGADLELPLDIARQVRRLLDALENAEPDQSVARFLMRFPDLRSIVRRVQAAPDQPYAEIHDNLIAADCLPIDMLRCKLSFFGAAKFDPKSDRWTRIVLYQGAPGFDDIASADPDDWCFPVLDRSGDAAPCTSP